MKSVLICIQPQWCELIANGKKTIEVRKTKPKLDTPFKVYIYETKGKKQYFSQPLPIPYNEGQGKVIGEFVCDKIRFANGTNFIVKEDAETTLQGTCLTKDDIYKYLGIESGMSRYDKKTEFYCWHISNLVIYDKPKELHHFFKPCGDCDKKGTRRCTEELTDCRAKVITRPPQSWCYVEKGGAE